MNLIASFRLSDAVARTMRMRGEGGVVVNIFRIVGGGVPPDSPSAGTRVPRTVRSR